MSKKLRSCVAAYANNFLDRNFLWEASFPVKLSPLSYRFPTVDCSVQRSNPFPGHAPHSLISQMLHTSLHVLQCVACELAPCCTRCYCDVRLVSCTFADKEIGYTNTNLHWRYTNMLSLIYCRHCQIRLR